MVPGRTLQLRTSINLHLHLRIMGQDAWQVVAGHAIQRKRRCGEDIRAERSVTGLQHAAIKADTEGSGFMQRTCRHRDFTTVHHRICRLRVLQKGRSTLAAAKQDVHQDIGCWHRVGKRHLLESGRVLTNPCSAKRTPRTSPQAHGP